MPWIFRQREMTQSDLVYQRPHDNEGVTPERRGTRHLFKTPLEIVHAEIGSELAGKDRFPDVASMPGLLVVTSTIP